MPSACGVEWSGTASGELDESEIPNEGYEPHYLNDADTKSESSFPVVDAQGNLRAGNVNSAWDLRGQGEGVGEDCLRQLGSAFDENPLPESAMENSFAEHGKSDPEWESGMLVEWRGFDAVGRIVHVPEDQNILMVDVLERVDGSWESTGYTHTAGYQDVVPINNGRKLSMSSDTASEPFGMNVEFSSPKMDALAEGFNKYGVRENKDGSIDVRFNAMEPGVRNGYEITPEFLQRVSEKEYGRLPIQLDHSDSQRANVGYLDSDKIKFADGFLRLQVHIPSTGSTVREDVISDFTHEPPAIEDVSVSFDPDTIEVSPPEERDGTPQFVDGRLREVSLTPFPAGYDNGGLTPAFSEAVDEVSGKFVDEDTSDSDVTSQLITNQLEIN